MSRSICTCMFIVVLFLPRLCFGELIHSDFETDANGSSPPAGWTITGVGSGGSQVTNTVFAQGQQSLLLVNTTSAFDNTAARAAFGLQTSGILRVTGFSRVEQSNIGITIFGLIDGSNNRANALVFGSDGKFNYVDGNTALSTGFSYVPGEWYYFEQFVDLDINKWSFSIFDDENTLIASDSNLAFDNPISAVSQIRTLNGATLNPMPVSWYIDDVSLQVVPEPSTFIVAAVGIMFLGAFGWRKRGDR